MLLILIWGVVSTSALLHSSEYTLSTIVSGRGLGVLCGAIEDDNNEKRLSFNYRRKNYVLPLTPFMVCLVMKKLGEDVGSNEFVCEFADSSTTLPKCILNRKDMEWGKDYLKTLIQTATPLKDYAFSEDTQKGKKWFCLVPEEDNKSTKRYISIYDKNKFFSLSYAGYDSLLSVCRENLQKPRMTFEKVATYEASYVKLLYDNKNYHFHYDVTEYNHLKLCQENEKQEAEKQRVEAEKQRIEAEKQIESQRREEEALTRKAITRACSCTLKYQRCQGGEGFDYSLSLPNNVSVMIKADDLIELIGNNTNVASYDALLKINKLGGIANRDPKEDDYEYFLIIDHKLYTITRIIDNNGFYAFRASFFSDNDNALSMKEASECSLDYDRGQIHLFPPNNCNSIIITIDGPAPNDFIAGCLLEQFSVDNCMRWYITIPGQGICRVTAGDLSSCFIKKEDRDDSACKQDDLSEDFIACSLNYDNDQITVYPVNDNQSISVVIDIVLPEGLIEGCSMEQRLCDNCTQYYIQIPGHGRYLVIKGDLSSCFMVRMEESDDNNSDSDTHEEDDNEISDILEEENGGPANKKEDDEDAIVKKEVSPVGSTEINRIERILSMLKLYQNPRYISGIIASLCIVLMCYKLRVHSYMYNVHV